MSTIIEFAFLFLIAVSQAFPLLIQNQQPISTNQILTISPVSNLCAGPRFSPQCRTADQVAAAIGPSFAQYGVTSPGEIAALVSLVAFESEDFKYNINISPGIPGQGTRNMQSAAFNLLYAHSIPALSTSLAAITTSTVSSDLSSLQLNAVRDLLTNDNTLDFGSAAWFLSTQCSASVRTGLQNGDEDGWEAYLTGCVSTTPTDERKEYWKLALMALGVGQ